MNIDDLTYGQMKQIAAAFNGTPTMPPAFNNGMVGKYVIVRCRDAGVHCGVLESTNGRECVLTDSRRIWYWKVAGSGDFLSAIALAGVHKDSKLSAPVSRIHLTENCEILECTDNAQAVIRNQAIYNG